MTSATTVEAPSNQTFRVNMDAEFCSITATLNAERVAVVCGEAGAGKSTLMRKFTHNDGSTTVTVGCSATPDRPLEPIAALAALLLNDAAIPVRSPLHRDALAYLCGRRITSGATPDRNWAFETLAVVLASRTVPTVVIVEDVHWAAPLTKRVLRELVTSVVGLRGRTRMVLTERIEPGVDSSIRFAAGRFVEIELQPWTSSRVEEYLIGNGGRGDWVSAAATWIQNRSGGNPLFIRELAVEALTDHQYATEHFDPATKTSADLPAAILDRLAKLSSADRRVLDIVSVLSSPAYVCEIQALTKLTRRQLQHLCKVEVLERPSADTIQFRHELFREAVLAALPDGAFLELSDAAYESIVSQDVAHERLGELARLAIATASLNPQRSVDASTAAGFAAGAQLDHEAAVTHLTSARDLHENGSGQDALWCELGVAIGDQLTRVGDAESTPLLRSVAERAEQIGEANLMGEAVHRMCQMGPVQIVGTTDEEISDLLERALDQATDRKVRIELCASGTAIYGFPDRTGRARELYDLGEALAGDSDELLATLHTSASYITLAEPEDLPRRDTAARVLHRAQTTFDNIEFAWPALLIDVANAVQLGRGDVRPLVARLAELQPVLGRVGRRFELLSIQSTVALLDGDYELSEDLLNQAFVHGAAFTPSLATAAFGGGLVALRMATNQVGELHDVIGELVYEQPGVGVWRAARAFTAIEHGDTATAHSDLQHVLCDGARLLDRGFTRAPGLVCLGEAALRLDDRKAMATLLDLMAPYDGLWTWYGAGTIGPVDLTAMQIDQRLGHDEQAKTRLTRLDHACTSLGAPGFQRLVDQASDRSGQPRRRPAG